MANYCKYYKQKKQVSYDSGATWYDVVIDGQLVTQKGSLYETDSTDCGYIAELIRWINSGTTCDGYDLCYNEIEQVSYDSGTTWYNTGSSRKGSVIEYNSEDCGYVQRNKIYATYIGGRTYSKECGDSSLTLYDTRPSGYSLTAMTSAVIGDCVSKIDDYAFGIQVPGDDNFESLTSVTIPNTVTVIGNSAFERCEVLSDVALPSGLTSIGEYAFQQCYNFTEITIPNSVTTIGGHAFGCCSGLTSITFPTGATDVYGYAFFSCTTLTSVTIPSNISADTTNQPSIDRCAMMFMNCTGLTTVQINNNAVADSEFNGCTSLTSVTMPNITDIGAMAFYGCTSLTSITLPNTLTKIWSGAFENCSGLTTINIPSGVTSINSNTFYNCRSLSNITIPDSVVAIGTEAFYNCRNLTSVTIPSSVTSIGHWAFYDCRSLTYIRVNRTTPPALGSGVFMDTNCPIYVPAASVYAYKTAYHWEDYEDRIEAIPT